MGITKAKTAKWFRSLLGSKNSSSAAAELSSREEEKKKKKKNKCALPKSADYKFKNEDPLASPYLDGLDANKHAIAVAAATAAVAEAALAAAQAAAEVVRLTSGRNAPAHVSCDSQRVAAVVKIQSAFRAYLARRALRALKGLVKLQALVRGHIVRRQSADMLRRMQAMARIQARASAHRFYISDSSKGRIKFSNYQPSGVVNPRSYHQWSDNAKRGGYTTKQSYANKESAPNWLNLWIEQYSWNNRQAASHNTISHGDDERSDKILEIDTWKPRQTTRRSDRAFPAAQSLPARKGMGQECQKMSSLSRLSAPNPSISSEEVSSVISAKEVEQVAVWAAESSPVVHSASSRPNRGMFTPTRSQCSRSLYGDYLSHPNYMANTESSRAKVRSQSAPRQRMQLDELGVSSTFGRGVWESDAISEKGYVVPANHRSHAHLMRQGARTPGAPNGVSSSYGYRF